MCTPGPGGELLDRGRAPADLTCRLNGLSPADVAVPAAAVVEDGFDARGDALSRTYRYRLHARPSSSPFEQGRALWWPHRIDREALDACAAALPGTHDFTAFTPTQTDHVRFERNIFEASWSLEGDDSSTSGSRPTPSCATWSASSSARCSRSPPAAAPTRTSPHSYGAPRTEAGETAPPHGLYLSRSATTEDRASRLRRGWIAERDGREGDSLSNWRILKIAGLISAAICQGERESPSPTYTSSR